MKFLCVCALLVASISAAFGQSGPAVTVQPKSQTVAAGQTVTLTVAGTDVANYYWYANGVLINGATNPSYTFTATAASTGTQYFALLRSGNGINAQSNSATVGVNPNLNVPSVTNIENFGTVTAAQAADGFGLNVNADVDWEFGACASIGCKWTRFDCTWSQTEIQQMPSNTSGGYALSTNCASGLQSTHNHGLHANLTAYWGPPYATVAVGTTSKDTPAGSSTITIASLISGSLAKAIPGQTTLTTNVAIGTPTPVALYEGGALVSQVSGNTLTLARATDIDLPAGTQITVSSLLYPPVLFEASTNNTAYLSNPSLQAFDNYMHFVATAIAATGNTGAVEMWNEPEQNAECWDFAPNCYDTPPPNFSVQDGSGIALALSAMTIPPVPGVKYANGWTDTNGSQTLYNPAFAPYFPLPAAQANKAYAYESFHVYGNLPEQTNWIPSCLAANSPGPLNVQFACTPIGDDPGSNFKYAASMSLYPSAAGGIHDAITETGVCRTCYTPEPAENVVSRFDLRQFLASQGNGISPVIFYQANGNSYLGDDNTFEWFHEDQTPYPVANSFQTLMADINTVSGAPVGTTWSSLMPTVTSYTGYYPLATVSFVGTAPNSTTNSVLYFSWQKTYTVAQNGSTTLPNWVQLASPPAVKETVTVPSGLTVSAVKDLVANATIPYTLTGTSLTYAVADNPIEVIFSPGNGIKTQSITLPSIATHVFGTAPITLSASATSGLAVSLSVSGPAKLSGSTLTLTGAGTVIVTATQTGNATYSAATPVSRSFLVSPGTPVLTWPTPAAITYGTPLSATQLNATASVPGTFTYTSPVGTILPTGNQPILATFKPADTTDYTSASVEIIQHTIQATPVITWPTPATIASGTALGAAQLDATSPVAGTFTYSSPAGTVLAVGSHLLSVTFIPHDLNDYVGTVAKQTIVVNNPSPKLTWATPAAITYGTALSATQLKASTTAPGTLTYSPAAGTVLSAGTHTLTVTFTPTQPQFYGSATDTVTITVKQVTPAITWAAPAAIPYGTALSATQLKASSTVAGTFTYSPALGTVLTAGTQTLKATFTPTDTTDYASATDSVTLTVTKITPLITWSAPGSIVYLTPLSAAQLDAKPSVPGTITYSPALGTVLPVGKDSVTAKFVPSDTTDYGDATAAVSITVTKAK